MAERRDRRLTRRRLLGGAAAGAGWLAAGRPALARRPRPISDGRFHRGVAAGVPSHHGITLWTRVDGIEDGGAVFYELAADREFRRVLDHGRVSTDAGSDYTVHQRVTGLDPGEQYFYRFHTRHSNSPVGRFRTLPPADSRQPLRLAFWSCQNWQPGYYAAHADIAGDDDIDLVVGLGDYIYEAASDPGVRQDHIGPDDSAQTLSEYRHKYRLYKSDSQLQAMHQAHAYVGVWDDHEVESSYYGFDGGNVQGRTRRVPFRRRRANGYRAFFEYMPFPRFRGGQTRIFRRLRLGAHAELFLLDLHQYASPLPCQDNPMEGPTTLGPCPERQDPSRSLLGRRQRGWLERGLDRSDAGWKLLGNSMMMMGLDYAPGNSFNYSQWDGWPVERERLMQFLLDRGIEDVVVMSGDIHTFFAGQVTTTGDVTGRPAAVEFIGSSISSHGIPEGLANGVDPAIVAGVTQNVQLLNPHIKYNEQRHRGYAVVEPRGDELNVEFRAVGDPTRPDSGVSTLKRLRVVAGTPDVELL